MLAGMPLLRGPHNATTLTSQAVGRALNTVMAAGVTMAPMQLGSRESPVHLHNHSNSHGTPENQAGERALPTTMPQLTQGTTLKHMAVVTRGYCASGLQRISPTHSYIFKTGEVVDLPHAQKKTQSQAK